MNPADLDQLFKMMEADNDRDSGGLNESDLASLDKRLVRRVVSQIKRGGKSLDDIFGPLSTTDRDLLQMVPEVQEALAGAGPAARVSFFDLPRQASNRNKRITKNVPRIVRAIADGMPVAKVIEQNRLSRRTYFRIARRELHRFSRPCAVCGKPFAPKRRDASICSPACRQRRYEQKTDR